MNRGWKNLNARMRDGRGQGHWDLYQPWLWIRRKNTSRKGNQVTDSMPGYRRASHFMARVEWHVGLLCLYLGATDVREQLPLWPDEHPHPLNDLFLRRGLARVQQRGLLDIAREAGIEHGSEIGFPDVPYVATLDLAVTLVARQAVRLAAVSLKPFGEVLQAEPLDRMLERLELERRYFAESSDRYVIADQSLLGRYTGGNLETYSAARQLSTHLSCPMLVNDFSMHLVEVAKQVPISKAINHVGGLMRLGTFDADLLWRHAVWTRRVDLDITAPIELGRPLVCDDGIMARALATALFGEVV